MGGSRTVGECDCPLATVAGLPTVREHFKLAVGGRQAIYGREEGLTSPHHHACFQEDYVQIKSLSHYGHED